MANVPEFGRRLRDAKRAWEQAHDRDLGWEEVGKLVGRAMGRKKPLAGPVVYRWFKEGREPKEFRKAVLAIAKVFESDPGVLAFGPVAGPIPVSAGDERDDAGAHQYDDAEVATHEEEAKQTRRRAPKKPGGRRSA